MSNIKNPTEPVPRYEFEELKRIVETARKESDDLGKEMRESYKSINNTLSNSYYTKDGVKDQFKIELSDYRAVKGILIAVGFAVLGLVFAVIQQYIINKG